MFGSNSQKEKEDRYLTILFERLRRADSAVESEYEENDRRLSWTLIFHAFLFQAYATCLQILDSNSADGIVKHDFVWIILFIICIVGITTAVITVISTHAAIRAICAEKIVRQAVEEEAKMYKVESHGFHIDTDLHKSGLLPTRLFPWILLAAWVIIILISVYHRLC